MDTNLEQYGTLRPIVLHLLQAFNSTPPFAQCQQAEAYPATNFL